jgi:hypothetical protein
MNGLAMDNTSTFYYPVQDDTQRAIYAVNTLTSTVTAVYQFGGASASYTANPDNLGNLYFGATFQNQVWKVVISTGIKTVIAGTGANGFANGPAFSTLFSAPYTALATSDGLWLLVADCGNHQIRRVALTNGETTTFVGGGGSNIVGNANGVGTNALMGISNNALGFVLDANNNGYLVDQLYYLIRRIDYVTLAVTTVAGTGSNGYADGFGTNAAFSLPSGLALVSNPSPRLYIAEFGDWPQPAGGRIRTVQLCPSFWATPTQTGTPSRGFSTTAKSVVALYMSGVTCTQANTPAVLESLAEVQLASLGNGIPSTWVTVTAECTTPNRRMLQAFSGVIFLITITVPSYATPAQVNAVSANAVFTSTASNAQLNAAIAPTLAILAQLGATSPQVVGAVVSVNGVACTGQACADLISPPAKPATLSPPVSVGAIVGGVIGALVVIVAIALTVLFCRRAQVRAAKVADLVAAAAAAQSD